MGSEIRSIVNGTIDYSALNRELSIPFHQGELGDLKDVHLEVYARPAVDPLIQGQQLVGGEDYRLYINNENVTQALIEELQASIGSIPHEILKAGYLRGARSLLNYARVLNSPVDEVEADLERANQIAVDEDWSNKLSTLGDRRVGWSGRLHCINYLFRFLPIQPVSMRAVWKRHRDNDREQLPAKLSELGQLVLTLSQGASPSFDQFESAEYIPSGQLYYQLTYHHKNPLEPRLREIASRLRDVSRKLEVQRIEYLTPIKTGVDTANEDISQGNQETRVAIDRLKDAVDRIS